MWIGDLVGIAVKIDPTTLSTTKGKFARVCVVIDHSKLLRPLTSITSQFQAVEYEGFVLIVENIGIVIAVVRSMAK